MLSFLFFLIAFLSEVIGTVAGFGSSVFFVPLAGMLFDFRKVLALTSVLHVFSNAAKLVFFGRDVQWRLLLLFGLPSVGLVIVGAYLSRLLIFKYTELILGAFLVLLSALLFFKPKAKLKPSTLNAVSAGGLAGFLAGLIGTGGAVRGLALAAFNLEKSNFVATSAAIDFGVDFSRMIIYLRGGYLPRDSYWYAAGLLLVAFAGSYMGKVLLERIEQKHFRRVVLALIFAIGLTTLGRFIHQTLR
jgi:uncharacterized membrane protein YfcA